VEFQCGVETRHCSGEEDGPPSPAAANEVKLLVVECSTAACLPACLFVGKPVDLHKYRANQEKN